MHCEPTLAAASATRAGVRDRRGIDGDLVRARVEEPADVRELADAAPHREGDEDFARHRFDHVDEGVALVRRGGDVEEGELVRPLLVVAPRDLDRIAGIHDVDEPHPLDDPARVHVETRDDARRESHRLETPSFALAQLTMPAISPGHRIVAAARYGRSGWTRPWGPKLGVTAAASLLHNPGGVLGQAAFSWVGREGTGAHNQTSEIDLLLTERAIHLAASRSGRSTNRVSRLARTTSHVKKTGGHTGAGSQPSAGPPEPPGRIASVRMIERIRRLF